MDIVSVIIIMSIGVILILTFYIIGIYNKLIDERNKVEEQFKPISIELDNIINLLPELLDWTKVSLKYEKGIINEINRYINILNSKDSINKKIYIYDKIVNTLNKLFNLSEIYIELKSDTKFIFYKNNFKKAEHKITYAKSFYNEAVHNYNDLRKKFPANFVAYIFRFNKINNFNENKFKD